MENAANRYLLRGIGCLILGLHAAALARWENKPPDFADFRYFYRMMKSGLRLALLLSFSLLLSRQIVCAQPIGKHILLEKITSAGCPSCPNGDLILQDLLAADSTLVPVAIHVNNAGHVDRMHSTDGDSILANYLWAHPTLMVDRYKFPALNYVAGTTNSWAGMISARQAMPMVGTIGGTTSYNANDRSLQVHLEGEILWDLTWDLRVNAYIVENDVVGTGLGYDQLNGNNNTQGHPLFGLGNPIVGYQHNWVLRDMLGGHFGAVNFPAVIPAGHVYSYDFSTSLDTAIDASQAYVILVLQRYHPSILEREVLNVVKLNLNDAILANSAAAQPQVLAQVWPNPASDQVYVEMGVASNWQLELLDLRGTLIRSMAFSGTSYQIERGGIPAGLYLLRMHSPEKGSLCQKLLLK